MSKLYFDIETGGRDLEDVQRFMPTEWPTGNAKDPAKIAAAIEEKKAEWLDRTALSAVTGQILAASVAIDDDEPIFIHNVGEQLMLGELCDYLNEAIMKDFNIYHFNGEGFDLPFICQRAAVLGLPGFTKYTSTYKGKRYWQEQFIDVLRMWNMSNMIVAGTNLGNLARLLGVGEKSGSGADFAALLKTDFEKAKAYALNDVAILRGVVKKMGI